MITEEAYAEAYQTGIIRTRRWLISRGLSWDLAHEVAQEAWVRGWEHRSRLRNSAHLPAWVNSIAINFYRTKQRHPFEALPQDLSVRHPLSEQVEASQLLASCSILERKLLEWYYYDGYDHAEIARRLGGSKSGSDQFVRIRLSRLRRKLQDQF